MTCKWSTLAPPQSSIKISKSTNNNDSKIWRRWRGRIYSRWWWWMADEPERGRVSLIRIQPHNGELGYHFRPFSGWLAGWRCEDLIIDTSHWMVALAEEYSAFSSSPSSVASSRHSLRAFEWATIRISSTLGRCQCWWRQGGRRRNSRWFCCRTHLNSSLVRISSLLYLCVSVVIPPHPLIRLWMSL